MTRIDHDVAGAVDSRDALRRRLLWLAWEVPCYGLALWALLRVNTARFGLPELITLMGFLAFFIVFRLVIRPMDTIRRGPGYALAVLCALAFAALLLHESARVRARWYRSSVLEVRLAALLADAPVPVVIADQYGRITEFNRRAERLTGHARGALIGRDIGVLVPQGLLPEFRAAYSRSIARLRTTPAGWLEDGGHRLPVRTRDGGSAEVYFYGFGIRYGGDVDLFGLFPPAEHPTLHDAPSSIRIKSN